MLSLKKVDLPKWDWSRWSRAPKSSKKPKAPKKNAAASVLLACTLLLAASADSCGKEAPDARENPYGDAPNCARADSLGCRQLAPAPSPEYSASQPAAEYEAAKERAKSGADE